MVIAIVFPKLQTLKILVRPLSKKRRFWKRFDRQQLGVSQILAKSPSDHFYHVFSLFWGKFIWKMSLLVLGRILAVFVDTLPADAKYPFDITRIWDSQFKCNYLKREKLFLDFLFHLGTMHQTWNILKKKKKSL